MKKKSISIVILAAGSSSRMGAPKQLLTWENDSLLNNSIKKVTGTIASEVFVVLGANFDLIEKEIKHKPITILENKNWKLGLGKSIACAVDFILKSKQNIQGLLIILADQPMISTSFLNEIIENYQPNKQQIVATQYEDGKIGVPVLFDACYFDELSQLTDDNGAKIILKKHRDFVKTVKPTFKNIDIDSKEDYKKYTDKYLNKS